MLCCVQSGTTALYWAAYFGYVNIVQMMVHDYLLTCGWNFGCGFIVIHASADLVCDDIADSTSTCSQNLDTIICINFIRKNFVLEIFV